MNCTDVMVGCEDVCGSVGCTMGGLWAVGDEFREE